MSNRSNRRNAFELFSVIICAGKTLKLVTTRESKLGIPSSKWTYIFFILRTLHMGLNFDHHQKTMWSESKQVVYQHIRAENWGNLKIHR